MHVKHLHHQCAHALHISVYSKVLGTTDLPFCHSISFFFPFPLCHASCKILHTLSYKAHTHTHRNISIWQRYTNSPRHTHPTQHQRESVMSVVEGVETALSANMLISYATEMLHPSDVFEMGHNTATATTHMIVTLMRTH